MGSLPTHSMLCPPSQNSPDPEMFVVVLPFNADRSQLVLIEKTRPKWQKGLYNGPGGHIEPNEFPVDAAVRELHEETGVLFRADELRQVAWVIVEDPQERELAKISVFSVFDDRVYEMRAQTDEQLIQTTVARMWEYPKFIERLMPDLLWLIPMALADATGGEVKTRDPRVILESRGCRVVVR